MPKVRMHRKSVLMSILEQEGYLSRIRDLNRQANIQFQGFVESKKELFVRHYNELHPGLNFSLPQASVSRHTGNPSRKKKAG